MILKDFNDNYLKENKDMKNSVLNLHRTLDTQIQSLESTPHPNTSLITDLKKKKLQLTTEKERRGLGLATGT